MSAVSEVIRSSAGLPRRLCEDRLAERGKQGECRGAVCEDVVAGGLEPTVGARKLGEGAVAQRDRRVVRARLQGSVNRCEMTRARAASLGPSWVASPASLAARSV